MPASAEGLPFSLKLGLTLAIASLGSYACFAIAIIRPAIARFDWSEAAAWLRRAREWAMPSMSDDFGTQVAQAMAEDRLRHARMMVRIGLHVTALHEAMLVASLAVMGQSSGQLPESIVFTYSHMLHTTGLAFVFLQLCHRFPAFMTARTLRLLACLHSARVVASALLAPSATILVNNLPMFIIGRVLNGYVCISELLTSTLLNMAISMATCYAYAVLDVSGDMLPVPVFVRRELMLTFVLALVRCVQERMTEALVRATLECKAVSQLHSTVRSLLSVLCDATVDLGADLVIRGPAEKLGALLLHCDPGRTLEGRHFLGLLPAPEAERFQSHVLSAAPRGHAQSLNTHLRDSSGTLVAVELLHASFQDLSGQMRHIVGIREIGTGGACAPEQPGGDGLGDAAGREEPASAAQEHMMLHSRVSSAASSSSSGAAPDVVALPAEELPAGSQALVCAAFLPASFHLPVVCCSPAFALLCGPSAEGCSLLEWVRPQQAFYSWVRDLTNAHLNGEPPRTATELKITLRTPAAREAGAEIRATCSVAFRPSDGRSSADAGSGSSSDEEELLACLWLSRIRRRTLRPA